MRTRTISLWLLVLCVILAAVPAVAQADIYYDNGPVNGQTNALLLNFGSAVTNSFNGNGQLIFTGFTFWVWLFPGDSLGSIEVSLGSTPFASDLYHNTFNNVEQSSCFNNHYGYRVCQVSIEFQGGFSGNNLWLTLQNARVYLNDDPVYWDQNAGAGCMSRGCPSRAVQKSNVLPQASVVVPSEAFTMYGVMISGPTGATEAVH